MSTTLPYRVEQLGESLAGKAYVKAPLGFETKFCDPFCVPNLSRDAAALPDTVYEILIRALLLIIAAGEAVRRAPDCRFFLSVLRVSR